MTAAAIETNAYAAAIAKAAAKMNPARIELAIQQVDAIDKAGIGLADQCAASLFTALMRCPLEKQSEMAAQWLAEFALPTPTLPLIATAVISRPGAAYRTTERKGVEGIGSRGSFDTALLVQWQNGDGISLGSDGILRSYDCEAPGQSIVKLEDAQGRVLHSTHFSA